MLMRGGERAVIALEAIIATEKVVIMWAAIKKIPFDNFWLRAIVLIVVSGIVLHFSMPSSPKVLKVKIVDSVDVVGGIEVNK